MIKWMKALNEAEQTDIPEIPGGYADGYAEAIEALLSALDPEKDGKEGPQPPEIPYDPRLPKINSPQKSKSQQEDPPHEENPDDITIYPENQEDEPQETETQNINRGKQNQETQGQSGKNNEKPEKGEEGKNNPQSGEDNPENTENKNINRDKKGETDGPESQGEEGKQTDGPQSQTGEDGPESQGEEGSKGKESKSQSGSSTSKPQQGKGNQKSNSGGKGNSENIGDDQPEDIGDEPSEEGQSGSNQQSSEKGSEGEKTPRIGDRGNSEEEAREREAIRKQIEKERAEEQGNGSGEGEGSISPEDEEARKEQARAEIEARRAKFQKAMRRFVKQGQVYGQSDLEREVKDVQAKETKEKAEKEKKAKKDALRRALNPADTSEYGKLRKNEGSILDQIEKDFEEFIKSAIGYQKSYSQHRPNKKYATSGFLVPGPTRKQRPDSKVILNVYYDRSTSWNKDKYGIGEDAIARLNQMVEDSNSKNSTQIQLITKVFYFADKLGSTPNVSEIGMNSDGGPEVVKHIEEDEPENVFIMTDEDLDYFGDWSSVSPVHVPGVVWFMFRGGISYRLMDYVIGDTSTHYYDVGDTDGVIAQRHAMFGPNPYTHKK